MALIKSYKGLSPKWGKDCYFSENATIVGDVTMGDQCSVWFNAVVRGDVAPITIGDRTNVQDGSCVHVTHDTGPTHIGSDVTIGHNVTVHACTIHDGALIGMGSTLLDGCEIGEGAIVAAGALVLQNTKIPPHEIWGGVPAKYLKPTRPGQTDNAAHYVEYAKEYLGIPVFGRFLIGQEFYLLNLVLADIHFQRGRTYVAIHLFSEFGGVDDIGAILLGHDAIVFLGAAQQYHGSCGCTNQSNLFHLIKFSLIV